MCRQNAKAISAKGLFIIYHHCKAWYHLYLICTQNTKHDMNFQWQKSNECVSSIQITNPNVFCVANGRQAPLGYCIIKYTQCMAKH